jgi:hypothetical protein
LSFGLSFNNLLYSSIVRIDAVAPPDRSALSGREFLGGSACRLSGYSDRTNSARSSSIKTHRRPIFFVWPGSSCPCTRPAPANQRRGDFDSPPGLRPLRLPVAIRAGNEAAYFDTGTWQRRRGSLDRESGRRVRVTPLTRRFRPNAGCVNGPTNEEYVRTSSGCMCRNAAASRRFNVFKDVLQRRFSSGHSISLHPFTTPVANPTQNACYSARFRNTLMIGFSQSDLPENVAWSVPGNMHS